MTQKRIKAMHKRKGSIFLLKGIAKIIQQYKKIGYVLWIPQGEINFYMTNKSL